ncbi:hypothetical protein BJ508DRAFT_303211 [Ascobolus immersus RN42]|uniref:Uncharacterized protein n=1 Tax=Ascobolus immersus RN42 TaxID=1160509 RepID=A0A3N4IIB6_ASCIM|nr:hypothetical protein BJ508DRAFT_303211 [Ascobolus immersus RN42]
MTYTSLQGDPQMDETGLWHLEGHPCGGCNKPFDVSPYLIGGGGPLRELPGTSLKLTVRGSVEIYVWRKKISQHTIIGRLDWEDDPAQPQELEGPDRLHLIKYHRCGGELIGREVDVLCYVEKQNTVQKTQFHGPCFAKSHFNEAPAGVAPAVGLFESLDAVQRERSREPVIYVLDEEGRELGDIAADHENQNIVRDAFDAFYQNA